jgi:hypothetical protein
MALLGRRGDGSTHGQGVDNGRLAVIQGVYGAHGWKFAITHASPGAKNTLKSAQAAGCGPTNKKSHKCLTPHG